MAMTKKRPWLLPVIFLLGYLFAWGTILIDRQMLIEEQRRLQDEVDSARIELKIMTTMDDYNEDYTDQVEWNREALEAPEPKEVGK